MSKGEGIFSAPLNSEMLYQTFSHLNRNILLDRGHLCQFKNDFFR